MVKSIKTKEEFDAALKAAGNKAVLVDFYAPWCQPCKEIAPKLLELSKKYTNVIVLKVNADKCSALADKYKIRSMPTFKVFKKGTVVSSFCGADKGKLKSTISKYN